MLAVTLLVGACGDSPRAAATPLPSPQASPSIIPTSGALGVLYDWQGETYTVSLIGVDGAVAAATQASSPAGVDCGKSADGYPGIATLPPPISTSASRVYYMDAQGVIRFLVPTGETGRATTVPASIQRRSMFTVSPDDQRIAVVVNDYTAGGVSTKLYVGDLNNSTSHLVFSETGAYTLWPTGWHGGSLVVAKVLACSPTSLGYGCCGPIELHIVDPATAVRRFTIGAPDCIIAGPPTPAGAACATNAGTARVYNWTASLLRTYPVAGAYSNTMFLSPNGQHFALPTTPAPPSPNPGTTTVEGAQTLSMGVCGWIDDTHIFSGYGSQGHVGDIATGAVVAAAAKGVCAGRLPGGL